MVTHTTILSAIISFGLLAIPAVAVPAALAAPEVAAVAAAAAGERLGGIDMQRACNDVYGSGFRALAYDNTCNGWKCWYSPLNLNFNIDTPRACTAQYGSGVYAWCEGGINNWSCYRA